MEESDLKEIARQLSRPNGEVGIELGNKMNVLNSFITSRTLEALSAMKSETILELGPGNGALSEPLIATLGETGKYVGIEPSDIMAEAARNCLCNRDCSVEIIFGDHLSAEISPSSLDGVFAVNVLYFIDDLTSLFSQLTLWLKPGARVAFGIRSEQSLNKIPFTQYTFNVRTSDEIKALMERSGFVDVESTYYDEGSISFGEMELPIDSVIISGKV